MRPLVLSVCLLALTACPTPEAPPAQPCPTAPSASDDGRVLGVVNGVEIRRRDLSDEIGDELKKITNESKQREFHMLWVAVDEAISDQLLEQEAKRQSLTVEELRDKEIGSRLVMPSDEVIQKIYDNNKDIIDASFEQAAPHIKRQLVEEQLTDLHRAFVARLRNSADVRFAVPAPDLPRFDVDAGNAPVWGNEKAKVTLIEFSDFECPYCGRASQTLKKLRALYPKTLKIVFRDFPLSQHENAKPAAEAAQCAREQGKFWEYHDVLFENARALTAADLKRYAEQVGLDLEAFAACLATDRPKRIVADNAEAARRFGVEGTPALFVNGIKLIGLLPLPLMQAIIDRELSSE